MSPRQKVSDMSTELYSGLLNYFHVHYPSWHLHEAWQLRPHPASEPMVRTAVFFDYVHIYGRKFYAANLSGNAATSLIEAYVPWSMSTACGQVLDIFQFQQAIEHTPVWLARVRWFRPWEGNTPGLWNTRYVIFGMYCIDS